MDCNYSIKIDITMQPQFITIEWRISVDDAADDDETKFVSAVL